MAKARSAWSLVVGRPSRSLVRGRTKEPWLLNDDGISARRSVRARADLSLSVSRRAGSLFERCSGDHALVNAWISSRPRPRQALGPRTDETGRVSIQSSREGTTGRRAVDNKEEEEEEQNKRVPAISKIAWAADPAPSAPRVRMYCREYPYANSTALLPSSAGLCDDAPNLGRDVTCSLSGSSSAEPRHPVDIHRKPLCLFSPPPPVCSPGC